MGVKGVLQPLAEFEDAAFDDVYGLNVLGTLLCLKYASLHLADEGRIVNIASTSGVYPWPGAAVYASSKAAIEKLTDIAAVVAFFCGPDSLWVTGQRLIANGGSGH